MADPNRLVEQCVHKGLMYLAESLQYYWPANYPNENNIALHLARSFAENGFQVWAEIPMKENKQERLDFLASNYTEEITVALEFKGSVEQPENNIEDLKRLLDIHKNKDGFDRGWPADGLRPSGFNAKPTEHRIYGIVTFHHAMEFAQWWNVPSSNGHMPEGRSSEHYRLIGEAIDKTSCRATVVLEDFFRFNPNDP
ncbi:MAG: hypothetical protein LBH94_00955, partial [Deltaproteobacteria bacterium]|nr:hypothetical protein [Deltaproteobacteria bacterium]